MRTMKYFAAVLLTAVIMLLSIPAMTVSAAQIKLYDEGGRLTSEQFAECEKRIRQASDKIEDFCDENGLARKRAREYTPVNATWPAE